MQNKILIIQPVVDSYSNQDQLKNIISDMINFNKDMF